METELKSIWDGWEKQGFHFELITHDGRHCAIGWPSYGPQNLMFKDCVGTYERVGQYLRKSFDLSGGHVCTRAASGMVQVLDLRSDCGVVIYANNALRLTPEDFRRIDRETQIEAAMPSLELLIDKAVESGETESLEVGKWI